LRYGRSDSDLHAIGRSDRSRILRPIQHNTQSNWLIDTHREQIAQLRTIFPLDHLLDPYVRNDNCRNSTLDYVQRRRPNPGCELLTRELMLENRQDSIPQTYSSVRTVERRKWWKRWRIIGYAFVTFHLLFGCVAPKRLAQRLRGVVPRRGWNDLPALIALGTEERDNPARKIAHIWAGLSVADCIVHDRYWRIRQFGNLVGQHIDRG